MGESEDSLNKPNKGRASSLPSLDPKEALTDLMEIKRPCKLCKGNGRNPTRYTDRGPDKCPRCGGSGEEPDQPENRFRGGGQHQKRPK